MLSRWSLQEIARLMEAVEEMNEPPGDPTMYVSEAVVRDGNTGEVVGKIVYRDLAEFHGDPRYVITDE